MLTPRQRQRLTALCDKRKARPKMEPRAGFRYWIARAYRAALELTRIT